MRRNPLASRTAICVFAFGLLAALLGGQERASDLLKKAAPTPAPTPAEALEATPEAPVRDFEPWTGGRAKVVRVPIQDMIAEPNAYVLRRALKAAIEDQADVLVLDIDTPGGSVGSLLKMMEDVDRFDANGMTIAYINNEAISAGALLASVADEIWFQPKAVIGSAGVVTGTGEDVAETMQQKIESYIQAKMRALSDEHPYRAEVVRAMMDADAGLTVEGEEIWPKGRMLNLTAAEAMKRYGNPPTALFGNGLAEDLEALLNTRFGEDNWDLTSLEVTWSEELATYLTKIAPILMAFGILGLFIEFKTPGFGIFGIAGIALIALVFLTNTITGLAGWEPFLVLLLGLVLVIVDVFLFPGTFILAISGIILIFGSLLWSLADVWPTYDGGFEVRVEDVVHGAFRLSLGVLLSLVGIFAFWRFLPRMAVFDRFVLTTATAGVAPAASGMAAGPAVADTLLGATGVVTRALRPNGEVEVAGRRYEARVATGSLPAGERVVVVSRHSFGLDVRREGELG
jgi:membrane-bound serine protease (ClpP class)